MFYSVVSGMVKINLQAVQFTLSWHHWWHSLTACIKKVHIHLMVPTYFWTGRLGNAVQPKCSILCKLYFHLLCWYYRCFYTLQHKSELSTSHRFLKKNVLLCGLWYGEDKPSSSAVHTFLTPLMTFLNRMYQEGTHPPYGTHILLNRQTRKCSATQMFHFV